MRNEEFSYFHPAEFERPIRAQILEEVCGRMGLRLEILQPREGFLCRIWDDGNGCFINHQVNVCTLNSYSAGLIAKDKTYTYLILQRAGFRVPRGDYYFRSNFFKDPDFSVGRGEYEAVRNGIQLGMMCSREIAEQYIARRGGRVLRFEKALIVKPNSLSHGKGVFRVDTIDGLEFAVKRVFNLPTDTEHIVIVQEYVEDAEFRLIMLDGELLLCVEKDFRTGTRAVMNDKTTQVTEEYIEWVRRASQAMQMRYIGLDFRCPGLESPVSEAVILEVNCNPGLTYYYDHGMKTEALMIYERLIKEMFEQIRSGL